MKNILCLFEKCLLTTSSLSSPTEKNGIFRKSLFLKISVGILIFSSCQKNIDLKLNKEFTKPKLVLNSLLDVDSIISVHISSSSSSFGTTVPNSIANAEVNLYENGVFKEKLISQQDGYYYSALLQKPKPNHVYEISVVKENFDAINATTTIPIAPSITNVVLDTIEKSISFQLADISGKNYYQFNVAIQDTFKKSYLPVGLQTKEKVLLSSENQDNFNEAGLQQLPLTITDELFDGKTATYKVYYEIYDEQLNYNNLNLVFNAATISNELYNYLKSRNENLDNSGNPFSEPVLVLSNVNNGYGVLGGKANISFQLK
ncbi:MAG: hypothetical protein RI955_1239 [Bacteroidota bacterium]